MLHQLAPHAISDLAGTRAGFPGGVVWAASVSHLHALGDPRTTALGIGGLVVVTALLSPVAAMLLMTATTLSQMAVISSMPMAESMTGAMHHTAHQVVNHTVNQAAVIWAGSGPNPQMDPNGLPGGSAASKIVGGLMFYGLLACAAAIVLGVMAFTAGKILTNHYAGVTGRIAVLAGIIGAVFIGACMTLVNWAFHLGTTFTPN